MGWQSEKQRVKGERLWYPFGDVVKDHFTAKELRERKDRLIWVFAIFAVVGGGFGMAARANEWGWPG